MGIWYNCYRCVYTELSCKIRIYPKVVRNVSPSLKLIWLGLYFQGCVGDWLTGLSGNQTNLSLLLVLGSYPRLFLPLKLLKRTVINLSEVSMTQTIASHVGGWLSGFFEKSYY